MERLAAADGIARAKINLFLDVIGRQSDGYHRIDGVMQSLELGDPVRVCFDPAGSGIHLQVTGGGDIPVDSRNLAWRAAERFLTCSGLGGGVTVLLEKRIPAAGGLAGGSSDAACVLRLLNRLAGEAALPPSVLSSLAAELGADVAFCLESPDGAMRTEGIGTVLTPVPPLPACTVLVANAGEGVSTPWGYAALDERLGDYAAGRQARAERFAALLSALRAGSLERVAASCFNIFEAAIIPVRPRVQELKDRMRAAGALVAMMSGSGPSVFGLFRDRVAAESLCCAMQREGITVFVTVGRRPWGAAPNPA